MTDRAKKWTGVLVAAAVAWTGVLLIAYPYLPEIAWRLQETTGGAQVIRQVQKLSRDPVLAEDGNVAHQQNGVALPAAERDGNWLIIPSIGVDTKILESPSLSILDREEGVWHDPLSKNPNEPGNMVIAGHRFQYLPPNTTTLYHLDKLTTDEQITVVWQGKEYVYDVYSVDEVEPDALYIKESVGDFVELTVYTCSPIGFVSNRLVVKAYLPEEDTMRKKE